MTNQEELRAAAQVVADLIESSENGIICVPRQLVSNLKAALAPAQPAGGAAQITEEMMRAGYKAYGNSLYHDKGWGNHAADIYRAMLAAAPPPPPADLGESSYARHMDQIEAANAGNRWLEPIVEALPRIPHEHMTIERSGFAVHIYWRDERPYAGFVVFRDSANFSILKTIRFATPKTPDLGPGLSRAAVEERCERLSKALKNLLWYVPMLENLVYADDDTAEHQVVKEAKATLAAESGGAK